MFTARFDPYYFELGPHEIRAQFLVQGPYQTSDSNKWRFYQNYMSGGGDPDGTEPPDGTPLDEWPTYEYWYGPVGFENNHFHTLWVF
jgi:hypothetical protein